MINLATQELLDGKTINCTLIKEVFDEIFSGLADDVQISAFITALKVQNLTAEEITAAIEAVNDTFKNYGTFDFNKDAINSITFENKNNYLDLALASDLVCCSCGLYVFKHSFSAPFETENSFNVLKQMGLKLQNQRPQKDFIENSGIFYDYLTDETKFLKYTKNLFRKIKFDNILYLTYKMLNPYKAKNAVIRVKNEEAANNLAQVCLYLNYANTIVFSGHNENPFISIENQTYIAEAWKNKIFTYVLSPELLDIQPNEDKNLLVENNEHNAQILLSVFNNKQKNYYYDAVVLNSAPALYITKKAASVSDGIKLAQKLIDDGVVSEKIEQLKKLYS